MNIMMTETQSHHTQRDAISHDRFLQGQIKLSQPVEGYRVGTDAVMLGASLRQLSGRALDMGAGVGGVSLSAMLRYPGCQFTLVEKDPLCAQLAQENMDKNFPDHQNRIIHGDVLALPVMLQSSFEHVFSNPPFHYAQDKPARSSRRNLAHYGDEQTLEAWIKSALWAAKPKGRVSFILRADRMDEALISLRLAGAGEIVCFPVWSYHSSPASRVILSARKGVKGAMALQAGIVLHHPGGGMTSEAQAVMAGGELDLTHPAAKHLSR